MTTLAALLAIATGVAAETPRQIYLYVAGNGSDVWSGRLAEPNDDNTNGPFATLERARDEIRTWKRRLGRLPASITVHVRGGDYVRNKTFELTAPDTGTENMPITYRAYKDEKVRLIGGRKVTNFKPATDPGILGQSQCPAG